jgi:hypothetical protein
MSNIFSHVYWPFSFSIWKETVIYSFLVRFFALWFFLYILNINILSDELVEKIFFHDVGCLFTLLIIVFALQKLFSLVWSPLSILVIISFDIGVLFWKAYAYIMNFSPCFPLVALTI